MSSPPIASMWLDDSELMLGEPSMMSTGICPMSVFDKFGWDSDILGSDTDELLDKICIKTEPDDDPLDDKNNTDFGSLGSIFPDLIDDSAESMDTDVGPHKSMLSSYENDSLDRIREEEKFAAFVKEEAVAATAVESVPLSAVMVPSRATIGGDTQLEKLEKISVKPVTNSIIRIPVKRGSAGAFAAIGGRTVKAVVVCPDRSKSIVCNVVRSTNKGIVIQKPVSRSLLNVCGSARNESTKLPIKVNVISSKDNCLSLGTIKTTTTYSNNNNTTTTTTTVGTAIVTVEPVTTTAMTTMTTTAAAATTTVPEVKLEPIEFDEIRPETPQSLIGSDEEFHPFSSPSENSCSGISSKYFDGGVQEDIMKSCLLDEDNLCSESYKCMPPAEVTGQIQPVIPDIFKYTPNSSPTNNGLHGDTTLDSFYLKADSNTTIGHQSPHSLSQFYSKAAANVDHDYGFTCRTPKSTSIFSTDSLGIQTPSASEPPTDSDDDETLLDDVSVLNRDFDCSELDREQREYFENLKHQLKLAELVCKNRDKEPKSRSSGGGGGGGGNRGVSLKERKLVGRNRKRKLGKDRSSEHRMNALKAAAVAAASVSSTADRFATAVSTTGTLKVRLPVKDSSSSSSHHSSSSSNSSSSSSSHSGLITKRKKTGSVGRIFSPSERHLHNTNEQVRRIEMRQSFEELRRLVPNLADKPRAPKVCILQEAKMYCDELFHGDMKLQAQVTALKCQQERLRCALSQLRRYAAASRH